MKNMNMKNMKNMNAQSQLVITKSGISWDEFENMDLGTHTWRSYEDKHENMNLDASFRIRQGFYSKTHEYHFLSLKPNFKSMYGLQISIMQRS